MGRRNFLSGATALGIGAGFSAPAIISRAAATRLREVSLRDQDLRFIGTEETFSTPELMALNTINEDHRLYLEETGLAELGPRRISAMDEAGLNVQILSAHTPSVQNVPGQEGIDFAYRLNKTLVDGPVATYPGRFEAFATLPLQSPEAAADELERAVREDGFLGALTNGHIGKKYLDHPILSPFWRAPKLLMCRSTSIQAIHRTKSSRSTTALRGQITRKSTRTTFSVVQDTDGTKKCLLNASE